MAGLVAGSYLLKVVGVFGLGEIIERRFEPLARLIPAALFAALVVVMTVGADRALVVDARVLGVVAGALAVWRRAPFMLVVLVGMAVTAAARALS